ncbi:MAG: cellulase family glycosylhydrolase, partial [Anaerolineae bacterium]
MAGARYRDVAKPGRGVLVLLALSLSASACRGEASPQTPVSPAARTSPSATAHRTPTAAPETPVPSLEPSSPVGPPPRMSSPEYGMQAFLWWRPETAWRDLDLVVDAGFGWVKQIFPWREIEGAGKGAFDWSRTDRIVADARARGLDLLVRVDHQPAWTGGGFPVSGPPDDLEDFADFLSALSSRYQGRIRAYQIWNEPNLSREWGGRPPDPAGYVALRCTGYRAIRAADPGALVVSAGLTPTTQHNAEATPDVQYLREMYAHGAAPCFDVLGAHAAGYKAAPETSPDETAADPALNHGEGAAGRLSTFRPV